MQKWEIEEVVEGIVEIPQSDMHRLYFDYLQNEKGITCGKDESKIHETIENTYNHVIQSYKNNVRMYRFSLRRLWSFLAEKKWVKEGFYYDKFQETRNELRSKMHVDQRFIELAELKDNTPVYQRHLVNPAKDRPL